jgi:hypothetical protein
LQEIYFLKNIWNELLILKKEKGVLKEKNVSLI